MLFRSFQDKDLKKFIKALKAERKRKAYTLDDSFAEIKLFVPKLEAIQTSTLIKRRLKSRSAEEIKVKLFVPQKKTSISTSISRYYLSSTVDSPHRAAEKARSFNSKDRVPYCMIRVSRAF